MGSIPPVPRTVPPAESGRFLSGIGGPAGAGIVLAGLLAVITVWLPSEFSSAAWVFAAAYRFVDRSVLLLIGLVLVAAAAVAAGHRHAAVAAGVAIVLIGVAILGGAVLLVTNLAAAMPASGSPVQPSPIRVAFAKAVLGGVVLSGTCLVLAMKLFAWLRRLRRLRALT